MSKFTSFGRVGTLAVLALSLAGACGGQSFTQGGDQGGSSPGGGSQGGSGSTAGSTSVAGSIGKAGSGHAGTGAAGGSAGAGVGGTGVGGAANEACAAPADSGQCEAYFPAWYHDASTGVCLPFIYGGCGGNANRYGSLEDCQKACPGGTPNYDACNVASDCLVRGQGCCGICDGPNITAHDLVAYNAQYAGLFQCGVALDMAGDAAGVAAPVACEPCLAPPPGQSSLVYFVPDCVRGECTVVDLRTSPVTACQTSSECKVRHGTSCCEGCGTDQLISVRNDGSFEQLVCGDIRVACPACVPPAVGEVPYCSNGRCALTYASPL